MDPHRGRFASADGREARLLEHVVKSVHSNDPHAVLDTIDKYALTHEFFMNVGNVKGKILVDELKKLPNPPKAVLELGTYCGYSTILLASHLKDPAARVYTLDISEPNVEVARRMIAHAGLSDKVVHVVKPLQQVVEELRSALQSQELTAFDLVFVDHDKSAYLSDLQLLVKQQLIREGSVVVADNLKVPGAPDYISWMEHAQDFTFEQHSVPMGPGPRPAHEPAGRHVGRHVGRHDIVGVSVYKPTAVAAAT